MTDVTPRQRIAAEVRAELARQNISNRDFADLLGMDRSAAQQRLSAQRSFRAEEIERVAEILGVPVARFLAPAIPDEIPASAA